MEERICTKAQKEASWKQKGLLRLPKSHHQGILAVAAKEYVEGLGCYSEVRRLLAAGKRPRDVAVFIQQHNELPILTFNSIKKYAQVYRSFFISPMETVQVHAKDLGAGCSPLLHHRLEVLSEGFKEITALEDLMHLHTERIHEQLEKEKRLGLPLPGLRLEIETQIKLIGLIIEKKFELGLYCRAVQDTKTRAGPTFIDQLSPEKRKRVAEVGTRILSIIEAARQTSANHLAIAQTCRSSEQPADS
jgi:hypothetical protein